MKPKHLAEKEKDRLLLLKPGCHQRVTLVGSCYKVPSKRSTSKQEMDISKAKRFSDWYDLVLKIKPCKCSNAHNVVCGKPLYQYFNLWCAETLYKCNDCANKRYIEDG